MKFRIGLLTAAFILGVGCTKNEDPRPAPSPSVPSPPTHPPEPPQNPPPEPPVVIPPSDGSAELTSLTAIFEASKIIGGKKSKNNLVLLLDTRGFPSKAPEIIKDKTSLVQNRVTSSNCQVTVKYPADDIDYSDGAAALFPRMKVKIDGSSCPLEINLNMYVVSDTHDPHEVCEETTVVKICKFIAKVAMSYNILDNKFSEEMKIKSGELDMLFKVEQTFSKVSWIADDGPDMIMNGKTDFNFKTVDLKEKVFSVKGTQDFDVKMTLPTSGDPDRPGKTNASINEAVLFINESAKKNFNFAASMTINENKAAEQYSINGEEVTAEKYLIEREKFSNSMISFGKKDGRLKYELPSPVPKIGRVH